MSLIGIQLEDNAVGPKHRFSFIYNGRVETYLLVAQNFQDLMMISSRIVSLHDIIRLNGCKPQKLCVGEILSVSEGKFIVEFDFSILVRISYTGALDCYRYMSLDFIPNVHESINRNIFQPLTKTPDSTERDKDSPQKSTQSLQYNALITVMERLTNVTEWKYRVLSHYIVSTMDTRYEGTGVECKRAHIVPAAVYKNTSTSTSESEWLRRILPNPIPTEILESLLYIGDATLDLPLAAGRPTNEYHHQPSACRILQLQQEEGGNDSREKEIGIDSETGVGVGVGAGAQSEVGKDEQNEVMMGAEREGAGAPPSTEYDSDDMDILTDDIDSILFFYGDADCQHQQGCQPMSVGEDDIIHLPQKFM
jgi:hypothetical protein